MGYAGVGGVGRGGGGGGEHWRLRRSKLCDALGGVKVSRSLVALIAAIAYSYSGGRGRGRRQKEQCL